MKPDKLKCGKGYDNCLRCPYLGECSIYDFNKLCDEWEKHHDEVVADLKEDISCAKGTIDAIAKAIVRLWEEE